MKKNETRNTNKGFSNQALIKKSIKKDFRVSNAFNVSKTS